MNIRRTAAAVTAVAAMTALAACGNGDDNGGDDADDDANGEAGGPVELRIGEEGDFIEELEMSTGGTGGVYYPLGGGIADIIENNTDASVNYQESGGSVDNLGQLFGGDAQLGLTQNDTANDAVHGQLEGLEDIPLDNIGWIAHLYPEAMHIVVRADSGIESIEDLEGQTIAVGDTGSGTRAISDAILEAHGLEEGDYDAEIAEFADTTDMLSDGTIDASMFVVGVPVASLTQLAASTDVTLLSIEDDVAAEIAEGGYYEAYDIDADSYDFLDEDVTTISVFAALAASSTEVSEDLAYDITAAFWENKDSITVDVDLVDIDEALLGIGDIPIHPGAERYYEEEGIDIP